MAARLLTRLALAILTLLLALGTLFIAMRALPGEPLARLGDERQLTESERLRLRARFGLDQPVGAQLVAWVRGAIRGDLGTSIQHGRPVTALLAERAGPTMLLGGASLALGFGAGVLLGVLQARHAGRPLDVALGGLLATLHATPAFVLGLALVGTLGLALHWLPVAGMQDPRLLDADGRTRAADLARHLVLPALTLTLAMLPAVARVQRNAVAPALASPTVLAARARGVGERRVLWAHAWRGTLAPVAALLGLSLPRLVTGAVFVEALFAWPGLGQLAASAAAARDYPLLMGTASLAAAAVVAGTLLADLAQWLADPRGHR